MTSFTESFTWQCLHFRDLSAQSIYKILQARQIVFVVEQNCVYLDADSVDTQCHHLIVWSEYSAQSVIAAYLRIVPPGIKYEEPSLGRIITTPEFRGKGLGKKIVQNGITTLLSFYPSSPIRIAAQHYLENFYQAFGFQAVSPVYLEDNIPHIDMVRPFV